MEGSLRLSIKILVTCLVFGVVYGREGRVLRSLTGTVSRGPQETLLDAFNYGIPGLHSERVRRQAPPFPSSSRDSNDQFIPRIDAPPPGSILTYDGKAISTNIGAFSIVPKTERRTPSINRNRPQYGTYRGDLPPPIPDIIPRDLPQFKDSRSVVSNFPPGFNNN